MFNWALPPYILNLHSMFHVSQLWKYVLDLSHMVKMDDVKVGDNLTMEASLMRSMTEK